MVQVSGESRLRVYGLVSNLTKSTLIKMSHPLLFTMCQTYLYHRSALLHVLQQTFSFMQGEKSHWLINKQQMHVESDCRKQSRWVLLKSAPCIVEDTDIRPVVELSKCGLGLARRGAIVVILNTTSVNTLDSVTGRWGWLEAIQCVSSLGPVPVIYFSSELQN